MQNNLGASLTDSWSCTSVLGLCLNLMLLLFIRHKHTWSTKSKELSLRGHSIILSTVTLKQDDIKWYIRTGGICQGKSKPSTESNLGYICLCLQLTQSTCMFNYRWCETDGVSPLQLQSSYPRRKSVNVKISKVDTFQSFLLPWMWFSYTLSVG